MLKMPLSITIISLSAYILCGGASAQGNCSSFMLDDQGYFLTNNDPIRISAAANCPVSNSNRTCAIKTAGQDLFTGRTNLSLTTFLPDDDDGYGMQHPFMQSINSATGNYSPSLPATFNRTISAPIDNTMSVEPGQTVYMNFTALLYCYTGTTGGCDTVGSVQDDTPVEVCAPVWGGAPGAIRVSGTYSLEHIDFNDVDKYSDPYAGQIPENAAQTLQMGIGALISVLAFAVFLM
ncbi:hypothetical protein EJ05DRAFT_394265 [Pseudovirgaria hyperparasitica]|uniref:Uncharacterized protein n=1 Tax=Pseudovirgaria hyperparasitica TaxID=470096 RepID=A0A6A6W3P4_9PEZI|nr:uncharacterized protein EJ05DRAFT_394265 [Pseudovirgaria hyperparasitica]KAF2757558.1 hypothetical protein EJ05DRAFT_394265 [Pseudovirgaria hyperparasitica]